MEPIAKGLVHIVEKPYKYWDILICIDRIIQCLFTINYNKQSRPLLNRTYYSCLTKNSIVTIPTDQYLSTCHCHTERLKGFIKTMDGILELSQH